MIFLPPVATDGTQSGTYLGIGAFRTQHIAMPTDEREHQQSNLACSYIYRWASHQCQDCMEPARGKPEAYVEYISCTAGNIRQYRPRSTGTTRCDGSVNPRFDNRPLLTPLMKTPRGNPLKFGEFDVTFSERKMAGRRESRVRDPQKRWPSVALTNRSHGAHIRATFSSIVQTCWASQCSFHFG
jgi:hypothetical protein